jgi:hypothetical protein
MTNLAPLSFRATLADFQVHAEALFAAVSAHDESAEWRFKWDHPRFRGQSVAAVRAAALDLDDARLLVAREYSFDSWAHLESFAHAVAHDESVQRFEMAADAVVEGDRARLEALLREDPTLARARSTRRHHATLLHYLAANGVEGVRQRIPANAVEIARLLLGAGSEPDAPADMYENQCTTMSMLVSSSHPAEAGLQLALAETLLEHGAALTGPGSEWSGTVRCALAFGFLDTARALAARGGRVNDLAVAAGLGELGETARLLPSATLDQLQMALALASMHGHARIVRLLLDAGADPNRYNPEGFHAHSTPLHQAVASGHAESVRLLVERGARLDARDRIFDGTPLGWAVYGKRTEIAEYLRERGDALDSTLSGARP